jgi:hypothetical protein
MIISYAHKYIFLKVSKTAGTSIQQFLYPALGRKDICIGVPGLSKPYLGMISHATAKEVKTHFPNEWETYFKFAFIRNPWDRMVSSYCFRHKIPKNEDFTITRTKFIQEIKSINQKFIKERFPLMNPLKTISIGDVVGIDRTCRFENLVNDFAEVCKRLKIPFDGRLPKAKSRHRIHKQHYSIWYDNFCRDKIITLFPTTIEQFGYNFEDRR